MKTANEPIVLSGRVYFAALLACELSPGLPERPQRGDVKLINVERGKVWFIRAYVAEDGKRWRNLALRKEAAVPATYTSRPGCFERGRAVRQHLLTLRGLKATWSTDGETYEVVKEEPPAPQRPVQLTLF